MSRIVNPEDLTVKALVSVKKNKHAEAVHFEWTLDYSAFFPEGFEVDGESREGIAKLLEKASKGDVITLQSQWRKKAFTDTEFDVMTACPERPRMTPKEKARKVLAELVQEMDAEELEALIAEVR